MNVYLTADQVGLQSGGGRVTAEEAAALKGLGPCEVWDRTWLQGYDRGVRNEPWHWDIWAYHQARWQWGIGAKLDRVIEGTPRLAHVYAGTFSQFVEALKFSGVKVSYTAAAHDVALSRREHERLGLRYDYPHLTDPELFKRYVGGYLAADVLVCPSQHSAAVMRGFGAANRIEVIPHGVDLPRCKACGGSGGYADGDGYIVEECGQCDGLGSGVAPIAPPPRRFRVGYLGACGPDKGLAYLLRAWAKLDYPDAVLVLGGRDSTSEFVRHLIQQAGARNVVALGWIQDVSDFYNAISLYVQPSVTEGFGIEVLEAMAHGRPVLCSTGAGAADLVPEWYTFPAADVDALASKIDQVRARGGCQPERQRSIPNGYPRWEHIAAGYTWDKIRARYQSLWRSLLT